MRTLDRYLAALFTKNFIVASFSMTLLFSFQAFLGDLFERNYSPDQLLTYHALYIPQVMVQMMPSSVLIATVMTLSGLARTNELVACFSIGFGLRRIMALILSIVVMISCIVLVLQDRILPPMFRKRVQYYWREMQKKPDFFLDIKQDKIWYRSQNLIYNLRRFDPASKTITGMAIYEFDDQFNLKQVINADHASFSSEGWRLIHGNVITFPTDDPFPVTQEFEEKSLQIAETPKDFQEIEKEVDSLRLKELKAYIQRIKKAGVDTKSYEVKFHSKISMSFCPLIMCILGIPFSVRTRREGGAAKDLGLCLGVTFFYWIFFSVGLSLGTNGALPPGLAAWLPSLIFGVLAAVLIARKFSTRVPSS